MHHFQFSHWLKFLNCNILLRARCGLFYVEIALNPNQSIYFFLNISLFHSLSLVILIFCPFNQTSELHQWVWGQSNCLKMLFYEFCLFLKFQIYRVHCTMLIGVIGFPVDCLFVYSKTRDFQSPGEAYSFPVLWRRNGICGTDSNTRLAPVRFGLLTTIVHLHQGVNWEVWLCLCFHAVLKLDWWLVYTQLFHLQRMTAVLHAALAPNPIRHTWPKPFHCLRWYGSPYIMSYTTLFTPSMR